MEGALIDRLAPTPAIGGWLAQHPWWAWVKRSVYGAVGAMVVRPFARLYLEGPTFLGFWGGLDFPTICAQLTTTNADMWSRDDATRAQCLDIIQRHFWSWMVLIGTMTYFTVLATVALGLTRRFLLARRRTPRSPQKVVVVKEV